MSGSRRTIANADGELKLQKPQQSALPPEHATACLNLNVRYIETLLLLLHASLLLFFYFAARSDHILVTVNVCHGVPTTPDSGLFYSQLLLFLIIIISHLWFW
jgi:hypothetical protein